MSANKYKQMAEEYVRELISERAFKLGELTSDSLCFVVTTSSGTDLNTTALKPVTLSPRRRNRYGHRLDEMANAIRDYLSNSQTSKTLTASEYEKLKHIVAVHVPEAAVCRSESRVIEIIANVFQLGDRNIEPMIVLRGVLWLMGNMMN